MPQTRKFETTSNEVSDLAGCAGLWYSVDTRPQTSFEEGLCCTVGRRRVSTDRFQVGVWYLWRGYPSVVRQYRSRPGRRENLRLVVAAAPGGTNITGLRYLMSRAPDGGACNKPTISPSLRRTPATRIPLRRFSSVLV